MRREYRIIHLLTIVAAFALLFTGVGSFRGSPKSVFHTWLGIASVGVIVGYGGYLLVTHGVRLFDGLRKPISGQFRESKAILENYTFDISIPINVKKGIARYNVLASYASVLLAAGFGELAVTGLLLAFLKPVGPLYQFLLQAHSIGVYLSAAFFFLHTFAVLKGENRPLLRAVFTDGMVPVNWAREHMQKFLER
jgi:formate dehydrogenase subunit gamma